MDSVQNKVGIRDSLPYDCTARDIAPFSPKHTPHGINSVISPCSMQSDDGNKAEGKSRTDPTMQQVSLHQAEAAWRQLLAAGYAPSTSVSLQDVMRMDPLQLSMLVTQQVISISSSNAKALCEQLNRATDLQVFLRNKQVEQYQEQINKSIEQADQVRKSALYSAVFDWINSAIEIGIGVFKLIEACATLDPLAFASGIAYCSAGVSGIVKGGAEFAYAMGANKADCDAVIQVAGTIQSTCEYIGIGLDIFQICRGVYAARSLLSAAEKQIDSGAGKVLVEAAANPSIELSQQVKNVAGNTVNNFASRLGVACEGEVISQYVARNMGRTTAYQGIGQLVEKSLETALKDTAKDVLKEGHAIAKKKLRERFITELRNDIIIRIGFVE